MECRGTAHSMFVLSGGCRKGSVDSSSSGSYELADAGSRVGF
jgi:hypothetical protein